MGKQCLKGAAIGQCYATPGLYRSNPQCYNQPGIKRHLTAHAREYLNRPSEVLKRLLKFSKGFLKSYRDSQKASLNRAEIPLGGTLWQPIQSISTSLAHSRSTCRNERCRGMVRLSRSRQKFLTFCSCWSGTAE